MLSCLHLDSTTITLSAAAEYTMSEIKHWNVRQNPRNYLIQQFCEDTVTCGAKIVHEGQMLEQNKVQGLRGP